VQVLNDVTGRGIVQLGVHYQPGINCAEIIQGPKSQTLKLIKQGNKFNRHKKFYHKQGFLFLPTSAGTRNAFKTTIETPLAVIYDFAFFPAR